MRERPIGVVVCLLLFAVVACSESASPDGPSDLPPSTGTTAPQSAAAVIDLTNAERTRAGLATFRADSRLVQAAQLHADQMARVGRLDHVLADAAYPRPEDRLAAAGYQWRAYAENIAFGQRSPEDAVSGWMQSSGHRANILNATLTEIGAGFARDGNGRAYWVQVFGRPAS